MGKTDGVRWLWILPTVVALTGCGVLIGMARRAAEELDGLRRDLGRLAALRPEIDEVRAGAQALTSATSSLVGRER